MTGITTNILFVVLVVCMFMPTSYLHAVVISNTVESHAHTGGNTSLDGKPGADGTVGGNGTSGTDGTDGSAGVSGEAGSDGEDGTSGTVDVSSGAAAQTTGVGSAHVHITTVVDGETVIDVVDTATSTTGEILAVSAEEAYTTAHTGSSTGEVVSIAHVSDDDVSGPSSIVDRIVFMFTSISTNVFSYVSKIF